MKIKHEDLKCDFCHGSGEREINIDGMDCPCECVFCNGTGINEDLVSELMGTVKSLIHQAEEHTLGYTQLEAARKLIFQIETAFKAAEIIEGEKLGEMNHLKEQDTER